MSRGKRKESCCRHQREQAVQKPTATACINKDDTSAQVGCRQALDIVAGCFLETSFRRSRSKSSPNSERPLISFCASMACCLHSSFDSLFVDASACRCPARLPALVKK